MHPILIIQGFMAPTLTNLVLKKRFQHAGFIAEDVPIDGLNAGDIRDSARVVEMSVNAMRARTGSAKVDLVGISMGGLIGLQYLRKLGGDKYIRRFVGIGAPFKGTHMARFMHAATLGRAPGAAQMIPDSEFLRDLHADEIEHEAEIYSLHASADAFVTEHSATLPGAKLVKSEHGFWPAGHYTPLFMQKDFELIKEILHK